MDTLEPLSIVTLLDIGCIFSTINADFVRMRGIDTLPLQKTHIIHNADGTVNGYVDK